MATARKKGRGYEIRVSRGIDINGKKLGKSRTWIPEPSMTPRQIEKELERQKILFEEEVRNGVCPDNKIRFADFSKRWMEEYAKINVTIKSYVRYECYLKRINLAIGHLKLKDITPLQLNAFYRSLEAEGVRKKNKYDSEGNLIEGARLAPKTILEHHRVISKVLSTAVKWGLLEKNVAERADPPKVPHREMAFLNEKGYDALGAETVDEVVSAERKKMWELISGMVEDMSVFDIFLYENDFHNLKAAVKSIITKDSTDKVFVENGTVDRKVISEAIQKRDFPALPEFMRDIAEKAVKTLMETGDGGLCDVLIDKAYLDACLRTAEKADNNMIKQYAELTVALADIRIAARGARLQKNREFFKRALAECKSLNVSSVSDAASKGFEDLLSYLKLTEYSDCSDILAESYTAFEKWCDDRLMAEIRKEKNNYFTIAPIAAYIFAKESELKMVGLVLTAKQNKLDETVIRERLRELYV